MNYRVKLRLSIYYQIIVYFIGKTDLLLHEKDSYDWQGKWDRKTHLSKQIKTTTFKTTKLY